MNETRRITPDKVVDAYRQTKIVPVMRNWATIDTEDNPCGCAMTALYLARMKDADDITREVRNLMDDENDGEDMEQLFTEALDLEFDYVHGFTMGFDGLYLKASAESDMLMGHEDGAAARGLIFRVDKDAHGGEDITVLI